MGEPNRLHNKHPMALVKEYVENEGLRMVDFFKQMDSDQGGSISKDEFVAGLTVCPHTCITIDSMLRSSSLSL